MLQTPAPAACAGENLSVTADAHNWIHATGGADYLYDAAGNMTFNATAPTQTYSYDQENRLTGAAGYAYTYDADGKRVRKSSGSTGTLYWYMTPGIVGESDLSGNLTDEYVFFDGERVARKSTNGVFYYFSDHLKTASVITDASGAIKSESDFYPWGGELQFVANDSNHYKFTGTERDSETQLDYFGARYYSNGLGRWVSADWSSTPVPVPYANFGDPQTLNLYGYVRGLPTAKADIDGHGWLEKASEDYWKGKAEEQKAVDAYVNQVFESHPLLKAWDQFTQKVDNALDGHGWKTDAQVAAADGQARADWDKSLQSLPASCRTPYPELKIGIVDPSALGGLDETLSRLGTSTESAARLGRKAAEAEAKIGIHGVSTTAGTPTGPASSASRSAVEGQFRVHNTGTRADTLHRTVELPKPVTQAIADAFNKLFGR